MSKRIFTVILALVLSLTALTLGVQAASLNPTIAKSDTDSTAVIVRWAPVSGAYYYAVQLRKDGTTYGTLARVTPNSDNTNLYQDFKNLSGGTYTATVTAYDRSNAPLELETTSSSVDIPISGGSTSYKITVSGTTGNIRVSWDAYKPTDSENGKTITYEVECVYKNASGVTQPTQVVYPQTNGTATYVDISIGDNTLASVTVYYSVGYAARRVLSSMTVAGSGYYPGTTDPSANVWVDYTNGLLRWINQGNGPHYVVAYLTGGTSLGNQGPIYDGYVNIQSLVAQHGGVNIYFDVYRGGLPNNGGVLVGSAVYYPYGQGGGYNPNYPGSAFNGINVSVNTVTKTATVSWQAVSYATSYTVTYVYQGRTITAPYANNTTSVSLSYDGGLTVSVSYSYNGGTYTIGSATVSADGVVTYGGTTSSPGSGNYITGNNCTLNVGETSSTITWWSNTLIWGAGVTGYNIVYINNDTGNTQTINLNSTSTTATIPLGYNNCNSFAVTVISLSSSGNNIVASVSYNGNIVIPGKTINSDTDKIAVTFDVPVWGLYGYLTAGDYTVIKLPTYFGANVPAGLTIDWYIDLDGRQYSLEQTKTTATVGVSEHLVYLGFYGTSWDGEKTVIPQTISYNALSAFKIVGILEPFSYPKNPDGSYKTVDEIIDVKALFLNQDAVYSSTYNNENAVKADWYKAGGEAVTGSTSYVNTWSPTAVCFSSSSGQTPTPTPEPTPTPTVCEHTFEYQSCTEVHWKHCTKCGYTCEVGEHSAANGSCSVCGRSSTSSRFDVNGDGQVNLQDAVMILRRLAHLD